MIKDCLKRILTKFLYTILSCRLDELGPQKKHPSEILIFK